MSDSDELRAIADRLDAAEELTDYVHELERECSRLEGEVVYLQNLLDAFGLQSYRGKLSVGGLLAVASALQGVT